MAGVEARVIRDQRPCWLSQKTVMRDSKVGTQLGDNCRCSPKLSNHQFLTLAFGLLCAKLGQ